MESLKSLEGSCERAVVFDSQLLDAWRNHFFDALSFFDVLSYLRAADVEQGSLYDGYTCRYLTDAGALARINHDGVVGEDVVVVRGDGEFGRVGEVHPLRGRGFPGNGDL